MMNEKTHNFYIKSKTLGILDFIVSCVEEKFPEDRELISLYSLYDYIMNDEDIIEGVSNFLKI